MWETGVRSFRGTTDSIASPILVKVISEAFVDGNGPQAFLFVYDDERKQTSTGFILKETASSGSFGDCPTVQLEDESAILVGDVLLVEPNGTCTVFFEHASVTNVLFLTERCNSQCLVCPQPPRSDTEDLVDLALRIIPLLDEETAMLGITGGEPTLVWDGLLKVLSACRGHLPRTHLQLLTNARILKDYQKVEELLKAAGESLLVCVTLYGEVDSLHDEVAGVPGAFWETLEGIHNLARAKVPVELRTVITRLNYRRLSQWAEFIYRVFPFAAHVALMGMEPIGLASENIALLWIDPLDYQEDLQAVVRFLHRRGMYVSIYNHQLCVLPNHLWPFARRAISEWKNIYISECQECKQYQACGGFFSSARPHHSRGITAIK